MIKGKIVERADSVWVSDITYIETCQGFLYLSLVTDIYSRKIMGYNLADNLMTSESLKALKMAIKTSKKQADVHHSDRGVQYSSQMYLNKLKKIKSNKRSQNIQFVAVGTDGLILLIDRQLTSVEDDGKQELTIDENANFTIYPNPVGKETEIVVESEEIIKLYYYN